MSKKVNKTLQIQQIKSGIGYKTKAKATLKALGLRSHEGRELWLSGSLPLPIYFDNSHLGWLRNQHNREIGANPMRTRHRKEACFVIRHWVTGKTTKITLLSRETYPNSNFNSLGFRAD